MSSINWYEFEAQARNLVRGWGFQIFSTPITKFDKEIDVYGQHILLYGYNGQGNKIPLTFIGECKKWAVPVNRNIVDQIFSLKDTFIRNEIPVIASVISYSGFSSRAERVAAEKDVV